MSTISEKLTRLENSMNNIRSSINADSSVPVEEIEAQVVSNNERVAILEEENYVITHPTCTMEIYAWEGMPLEGHLIRVKLIKIETQEIVYESPLEGEETNFFTFNDLELGKYYECTVLSCKALDGSKGNYAVHPWNFCQFIAFNDNAQSIWLDPISSQGYHLNMSCMDDTTGELIDNLSLADGYIEIYNESDGEGWMERSFSTTFPAREYFTGGNFSAKLCNLYRFDGRIVEFSDEKQYFTITDHDVDVLFHFKTLGFPSHPVMLNFVCNNGETIPSNCTIDFTVTKSDGTVEWHSVAGGNMAQVSMEIGTRNVSVKNIWNTDTGESCNELYVLPHDEFFEVYGEMEWTIVIALQDTAGGEPEIPEEPNTNGITLHFMDERTMQHINNGYITSARFWKDGEVAHEFWDSGSSTMYLENIEPGIYEVEITGIVPMPDTGLPEVDWGSASRVGITVDGIVTDFYLYIFMPDTSHLLNVSVSNEMSVLTTTMPTFSRNEEGYIVCHIEEVMNPSDEDRLFLVLTPDDSGDVNMIIYENIVRAHSSIAAVEAMSVDYPITDAIKLADEPYEEDPILVDITLNAIDENGIPFSENYKVSAEIYDADGNVRMQVEDHAGGANIIFSGFNEGVWGLKVTAIEPVSDEYPRYVLGDAPTYQEFGASFDNIVNIIFAPVEDAKPTKFMVRDVSELDTLENVADGSTAQVIRSSYNSLSFDEGTVLNGSVKMPDYADINNVGIDWNKQSVISAEFSEEYLSRHFHVQVSQDSAIVTYSNYDTGETITTRYEGDGIWYNRVEGPDIIDIDKEMKVYVPSLDDNYQVCSYFVQAETPVPIRDYTYTNGAWTRDATKVISINDYFSEIGDVLPAGTTLAFRRPASGTIVNEEGALMLDLQLTQYQDAAIRWGTSGTTTHVDGVYGNAMWFCPQLEDMGGAFRDDMSLREKVLLEFHNSLEDTSPEHELIAERLEVLGDDLRDQIMLLRNFVPYGEEHTEEYTVQNIDTLWPDGFAYVTLLAETQVWPSWSNDGVMAPVYKTLKDFFGVVVKADQPGTAIESEI